MDENFLKEFSQALDKKYSDASSRFRITQSDEATIRELLSICYKKEVTKRKQVYQVNAETEQYISKSAKWLCRDLKTGLLLYGGVGNGKSTLAKAICGLISTLNNSERNFNTRNEVFYCSALDLAKDMVSDSGCYNTIKNKELLFIDDVGTEPASVKSWGNEISPVTEILYARYEKQLFTIITSNLNDKEMMERYGVRIADRIEEMFDKIYFSGKSYRK